MFRELLDRVGLIKVFALNKWVQYMEIWKVERLLFPLIEVKYEYDHLEIFEFGFIQRALIAGIAISAICSVIGLFLVLRRQSLFGDSLAHMAFGGVAVGLYTNTYPLWTAFIASILLLLALLNCNIHQIYLPTRPWRLC